MNQKSRVLIAFSAVLMLGGIIFSLQSRQLSELKSRSATNRKISHSATVAPVANSPGTESRRTKAKALAPEPIETLVARLKVTLLRSLTPDQLAEFYGDSGEGNRIVKAANLDEAAGKALRQGLSNFSREKAALYLQPDLTRDARSAKLAEMQQRREAWLEAQLGKERNNARLQAETQARQIRMENSTRAALSRLDQAVSLTQEQKARLNSGFMERLATESAGIDPELVVKSNSRVEMEPPTPDISEDVEKILTTDQLETLRENRAEQGEQMMKQQQAMMVMIQSFLPAIFGLADEH